MLSVICGHPILAQTFGLFEKLEHDPNKQDKLENKDQVKQLI